MIKFEHENVVYAVEFMRDHRRVRVADKLTPGVFRMEKSREPFTTASVVVPKDGVRAHDWEVYKQATVGVAKGDRFSYEDGRMYALKKLTPLLPKEMRTKMWEAYMSRPRGVSLEPKTTTKVDLADAQSTSEQGYLEFGE